MFTGLDHIIIGVHDLDSAVTTFSERLGLTPSGGGIHPVGGTANRIIVIGDTYLELIAVRDPTEAQQSMLERLALGEGYLNCVLASDNIELDSEKMRGRSVSILGPNQGELRSEKGTRGWIRTNVERPDLTQHYPFIIQHDSTGEERRHRLAGWSSPPEHPLGAVQVLNATIAVESLAEAAPRFQHIYGIEPSSPFTGEVDAWTAMLVAFQLGTSGQSLELAEPLPLSVEKEDFDTAEQLPEPGALKTYLDIYGESLCRITLAVENLSQARAYLDKHGAIYTYQETPHPVLWIHPDSACGAAIVLHQRVSE